MNKSHLKQLIKEEILKVLNEYSAGTINQLVTKFQQKQPDLEADIIQSYIDRFSQIKDSPKVSEKDITKYSWEDLKNIVDLNPQKRIKAGKINDGNPSENADLVYNKNGLRIYAGTTRKACIRYGNGYSFCISTRSQDTAYYDYRYGWGNTFYFVFDDTKTSERDKNGKFIDPEHLLVVTVFPNEDDGEIYNTYTVTTADNPTDGNDYAKDFNDLEEDYPRLKGLKNTFQSVEGTNLKAKALYDLQKEYDEKLTQLTDKLDKTKTKYYEKFWGIEHINKLIDDLITNKLHVYYFSAQLLKRNGQIIISPQSLNRHQIAGNAQVAYEKFINHPNNPTYYNLKDPDWDITYKDFNTDSEYMLYLKDIKQLVDEYRNKLLKLKSSN